MHHTGELRRIRSRPPVSLLLGSPTRRLSPAPPDRRPAASLRRPPSRCAAPIPLRRLEARRRPGAPGISQSPARSAASALPFMLCCNSATSIPNQFAARRCLWEKQCSVKLLIF